MATLGLYSLRSRLKDRKSFLHLFLAILLRVTRHDFKRTVIGKLPFHHLSIIWKTRWDNGAFIYHKLRNITKIKGGYLVKGIFFLHHHQQAFFRNNKHSYHFLVSKIKFLYFIDLVGKYEPNIPSGCGTKVVDKGGHHFQSLPLGLSQILPSAKHDLLPSIHVLAFRNTNNGNYSVMAGSPFTATNVALRASPEDDRSYITESKYKSLTSLELLISYATVSPQFACLLNSSFRFCGYFSTIKISKDSIQKVFFTVKKLSFATLMVQIGEPSRTKEYRLSLLQTLELYKRISLFKFKGAPYSMIQTDKIN
ncbi:hypothetical protein EGR_00690 [Echinococcus granulosus]|uniref:Uncharacterized protein n=1 Tax=Echinococcus granulosus TaxID=6210 RepID=W6UU30_ECHGR|nr:hypothetical protein EGR_00690 [Echinococcus granulosus]EUB64146.1 hypothetical protein EGR_00690 [Echinococcus granulosus]